MDTSIVHLELIGSDNYPEIPGVTYLVHHLHSDGTETITKVWCPAPRR